MDFTATSDVTTGLLISRMNAAGAHSGDDLSRQLRRGEVIRLRRGIFLRTRVWADSYPLDRYLWTIAATAAQLSQPTFCRESALALHGIPLVAPPLSVQVRAKNRSSSRSVRQSSMTGKFSAREFLHRALGDLDGVHAEKGQNLLIGFGTHFVSPSGVPDDETAQQLMLLGSPLAAEPLPLALVDTVPRMPFDRAVVVLDAALRGTDTRAGISRDQLAVMELRVKWTKPRLFAWQRALSFADPLSESVGESVSRVRISELGFEAPTLQSVMNVNGTAYRLDFCWEDAGVVGEFDGWMKYRDSGAEALRAEKIREDAIRSTGLTVVRWYWEDLQNPEGLRRKLLRAGVPLRSA